MLGETAAVLEQSNEWRRVRPRLDGYEGWVHRGYLIEGDPAGVEAWEHEAAGWSMGAALEVGDASLRLPLRARVVAEGDVVRLPDGRSGRLLRGAVPAAAEVRTAACVEPPERWAVEHFAGAPYLWGGVTPWGVDCSGLVQTTFAARGISLPRDAAQQAGCGAPIAPDAIRPGDLLFFRGDDPNRVTHVAFAAAGDSLVHSTIACGGVVTESWLPESRAAGLRERLVGVRRVV